MAPRKKKETTETKKSNINAYIAGASAITVRHDNG